LERFPRSQHRPSLITILKIVVTVPSEPYIRWNFRKANWKKYSDFTNQLAKDLSSPNTSYVDKAYQHFCNSIITAARAIPRGNRIGMPSAKTSTKLSSEPHVVKHQIPQQLPCLPDSTKSEKDVDQRLSNLSTYTHSSRLAWTTINNLIGRSTNSHRPCPITANSITSQLLKNWTYKTKDRELGRLVNKEVSDLWRIPTLKDKCISEEFTSDEFALVLQQLKPGKTPGPDSIMPGERLE